MAEVTRRIGLSLGADVCWPCFEHIMRRLDLRIPYEGDTLRFEVERVTIEPYDLVQPCKYDVVVDRLTHWYHTSREWIKKSIMMNDLYVFNNPWSVQVEREAHLVLRHAQAGDAHPRDVDDPARRATSRTPT